MGWWWKLKESFDPIEIFPSLHEIWYLRTLLFVSFRICEEEQCIRSTSYMPSVWSHITTVTKFTTPSRTAAFWSWKIDCQGQVTEEQHAATVTTTATPTDSATWARNIVTSPFPSVDSIIGIAARSPQSPSSCITAQHPASKPRASHADSTDVSCPTCASCHDTSSSVSQWTSAEDTTTWGHSTAASAGSAWAVRTCAGSGLHASSDAFSSWPPVSTASFWSSERSRFVCRD